MMEIASMAIEMNYGTLTFNIGMFVGIRFNGNIPGGRVRVVFEGLSS